MSLFSRNTGLCLGLIFASTLALAAPAKVGAHHPLSCKPLPPAEVTLRLASQVPGQATAIEAEVHAFRLLEDVRLELTLPIGDAGGSGAPRVFGKIEPGSKRNLAFRASIPARGRSEIYARITFRMPGGEFMTSAAHLSFTDGRPTPPPTYRSASWNGTAVLETPAGGVK